MKTFIIAESGSTWHYSAKDSLNLARAKKCIRIAKQAGADVVKFQWTSDQRLMEQRRKVKVGSYDILAWPEGWLKELAAECEEVGIEFMCTVFLPKDVATIAPLVLRFKVASLEAMDGELYKACKAFSKLVIVSTGAVDPRAFVDLVRAPHTWDRNTQYLACTAGYPTPLDQLNLQLICDYARITGLSDHSGDLLTGALAVACGAEIVEVHMRLDETPVGNPDYKHSLSPARLLEYVRNIRKAELMLGDGIKKVEECEKPMIQHRVTA